LPPGGIAQVLSYLPRTRDPNLIVGTETHDDAGVYALTPDIALVQTIDFFPPVVDDPFVYGQIAAANALSDVYAMGGTPLTAMNLVGYPDDKLSMDWLGQILAGGAERCIAAKCTIVGGHTIRDAEIKFGLSVTGTVHPKKVLTNANAKPGDVLILTKPLGTGFVTTANKKNACPPELLKAACDGMVQLNAVGRDPMVECGAHAATDVTGFGLAGHAFEMADGSKTTLVIDIKKLPLIPGIEAIDVTRFRTRASKSNREYTEADTQFDGTPDPLRLEFFYDAQTSGGLLISVPADRADELTRKLLANGALCAVAIGEVVTKRDKALWVK
jgi:selenide, water dikinase